MIKKIKGFAQSKHNLVIFIAIFTLISITILFITRAATPAFSIEPEGGTVPLPATTIADANASGGSAIKFGDEVSTSSDFHTCYPDAFCTPSNQVVVMNGANIRYIGGSNSEIIASRAQMDKIKLKGFNSVRLVMDWNVFQPSAGTAGFSTTAFNRLRAAVDNAKAAGVYVILDPIHFGGEGLDCGTIYRLCIPPWARVLNADGVYQGSVTSVQTNARDYIEKVSTDYANEPTVVAIDLVNEPKPKVYADNAAVVSMYSTLIGWARGKDPDKILMIEPTGGNKLFTANTWAVLSSKTNIVYSFHPYYGGTKNVSGAKVCSADANNDGYSDSSGTVCGNQTYENQAGYQFVSITDLAAHIDANLNMLADSRLRIPLHAGEWGIIEGDGNVEKVTNSVQWRKDMTTIFNEKRIGRAYWQFANSSEDGPFINLSMTRSGSSTPGDWKLWVADID